MEPKTIILEIYINGRGSGSGWHTRKRYLLREGAEAIKEHIILRDNGVLSRLSYELVQTFPITDEAGDFRPRPDSNDEIGPHWEIDGRQYSVAKRTETWHPLCIYIEGAEVDQ